MSDLAREELRRRAMETAVADVAVIPIYFEGVAWAFRKGLAYKVHTDQFRKLPAHLSLSLSAPRAHGIPVVKR